jgi:hypothetical protein
MQIGTTGQLTSSNLRDLRFPKQVRGLILRVVVPFAVEWLSSDRTFGAN